MVDSHPSLVHNRYHTHLYSLLVAGIIWDAELFGHEFSGRYVEFFPPHFSPP